MEQNEKRVPRVLSIAGTDPTGGAGLQADLKTIGANGGYGMGVVTAIVAQNTQGVKSIEILSPFIIREQLLSVSDDVVIDAVKIGMLGTTDTVNTVATWLDSIRPPVVVFDPVMISTSGDRLLPQDAEAAIVALIPKVDVVTPNVPEMAVLASRSVAGGWGELLEQAVIVSERFDVIVSVKGGHLEGPDVKDAIVDPHSKDRLIVLSEPRIKTTNTHGTGCALSTSLATLRPQVADWPEALNKAKSWLTSSIAAGATLKVGSGNGPIDHFWFAR